MRPALPRRLLGLVAVLLAGACGSEPPHPLEGLGLTAIYDEMGRRQVARLFAADASPRAARADETLAPRQLGKGVALGDGSWILTGAPAAFEADVLRVQGVDGREGLARRVATDAPRGLALLRLETPLFEPGALAIEALPESGEELYLMVEDDFTGLATLSGPLSGRREHAGEDLLRLWGRVLPEEVGGPVYATSGRIVGIVIPDDLVDREVRASYAQAVPALLEFLEGAGAPLR